MVWLSGGNDDDAGLFAPGCQNLENPGYPKPLLWHVSSVYRGRLSLASLWDAAPCIADDPGKRDHLDSFSGSALGQVEMEVGVMLVLWRWVVVRFFFNIKNVFVLLQLSQGFLTL